MENTNANNTFQELSVQPPIDLASKGAQDTDRAKLSGTPGAQLPTLEANVTGLQTCDNTDNQHPTIEEQLKGQHLRSSAHTQSPLNNNEVITNYTSKQQI